jgi:hypothetical protein
MIHFCKTEKNDTMALFHPQVILGSNEDVSPTPFMIEIESYFVTISKGNKFIPNI